MTALEQHFALLDGGADEASDWRPILPGDVLEGELLEDPTWPNRMRRIGIVPGQERFGVQYEIEVQATGDRVRVRLPFGIAQLPEARTEYNEWHYEDVGRGQSLGAIIEDRLVVDSIRRRWFEHVDGETHLLMKVERLR